MYLRVFENKSELVVNDGKTEVFLEEKLSQNAKQRYQKIIRELSNGYLEKPIIYCRDRPFLLESSQLKSTQMVLL